MAPCENWSAFRGCIYSSAKHCSVHQTTVPKYTFERLICQIDCIEPPRRASPNCESHGNSCGPVRCSRERLGFGLGWWPYTQAIAKLDEPDEFIAAAVNELTYLMILENLAH